MNNNFYSDAQLIFLIEARRQGLSWSEVAEKFNKKFGVDKSYDTLRMAYNKYRNSFDMGDEKIRVKELQSMVSTRLKSAQIAKENKEILLSLESKQGLLEQIEALVDNLNKTKVKFKKVKLDSKKKRMTLELMLSDLHYGKKTDTFDLAIARQRMQDLCATFIKEIHRSQKLYNVDRIILALLGDLIESSTMHGIESAKGCEFGNSRQVAEAINSIYLDMILPVATEAAKLGIVIDIPAVTGNHDRTEKDRTMHNPGEDNLTYIIYKSLQLICEQKGFKHVRFHIPKGPYQELDIYGNTALYEHFDNSAANTRAALMKLLSDRQTQIKKIVDFFRGGHYHESTVYGRGKIIVNGSLPGPDSYSMVKGFESHSDQMINYYVETTERPNCYYRSFPVYLK